MTLFKMYFQAHTFEVNSCFRSTINGSINKVWNFRINLNQISLSERYPTKIGNRKVCVVLILDEIERETETETEIEIETEAGAGAGAETTNSNFLKIQDGFRPRTDSV